MTDDSFVTLETLHDPMEAEVHRELLQDAGIVVATPGLEHRHMLGMIGGYVKISIKVRQSDLEAAREILTSLEDADEILEPIADPKPPAVDGPYRGGPGDDEEGYTDKKLKRIAAFASLVLTFGSGHFYARQMHTAWLILALEANAIGAALLGHPELAAIVPALMIYDFFGGLRAVDRFNAGEIASASAQLARVPLVLAFAGAAYFSAPYLDEFFADDEAPAAETRTNFTAPWEHF